jgi:hypothetical protein
MLGQSVRRLERRVSWVFDCIYLEESEMLKPTKAIYTGVAEYTMKGGPKTITVNHGDSNFR